mmetsp:Transcript_39815/g.58588  ORF Transcript_39815/g.58588 Transcript_39815/m.58588 type:complete len:92 (+) Transcript_39815:463-738(+)
MGRTCSQSLVGTFPVVLTSPPKKKACPHVRRLLTVLDHENAQPGTAFYFPSIFNAMSKPQWFVELHGKTLQDWLSSMGILEQAYLLVQETM